MDMKNFGNYVLVEEFAETLFGKFYKAIPLKNDPKIFYLQILGEDLTKEPQALTIIKTYFNRWKNIKDLNTLNLIDFFDKDGQVGYVFEYQRGRILSDMLSECIKEGLPLAYDQAVYLISRITDAIVSISNEDFFYGNLTSDMIFITFEGEVKLFPGVFRDLQTTPLKFATVLEKYLRSLPQDLKEGRAVKSKDQIYFLGLLFFEFLTRETFEIPGVPFNPEERIAEARKGSGFSEGLPENLAKILEKSLLPKSKDAYKSVEEFKSDIDELIASGEYSPSTFNTAFLIHTLYRDQDEIEAKRDEELLKIDRKKFEPKKEKKLPVIPPPEPKKEEPLTFGIDVAEAQESKSKLFVGIGAVAAIVIIVLLGFILFGGGKKGEDIKAKQDEELKLKQLEEQNRLLKEQLEKLQAETKAKEEEVLKAKTPQEKAEAQKALEEAKKKLLETQKLQETVQPPKQEKIEESKPQPKESTSPAVAPPSVPTTQEKAPEQEKMAEQAPAVQPAPSTQPEPAQTIKQGDYVDYISLDVKPNIIADAKPEYPPLARQNKVEGRVYVKVEIDENGAVTKAEILKGPDPDYGIKGASLEAAKKTKFSPAMKNGVRVKTSYTLNYLFTFKK